MVPSRWIRRFSLLAVFAIPLSGCAAATLDDTDTEDVSAEDTRVADVQEQDAAPDAVPDIFEPDAEPDVVEDTAPDAEPDAESDVPEEDTAPDIEEDPGPTTVCGNDELEEGEGCDDGNTLAGDGCGPSCKREIDYICAPCGDDDAACGGETDLCIEGSCAADCRDWPCPVEHTCQEIINRPVRQHQCVPDAGCGTGVEVCDNGADDDGDTRVDCDDNDCADEPICNVVGGPGSCDAPEVASLGRHNFVPTEDIRSPSCLTIADNEAVFIFRPIEVTTYCFDTRLSQVEDTVVSVRTDCFDAETEEFCVDDVTDPELDFRAYGEWEASSMAPVFVIVDVYDAEEGEEIRLEISRGACPLDEEPEPEPEP
ncbi:MAG: cysteine-rich repeat protein [Bradymonadia bacterium]|jgi:cysteine-rich repeat protein